MTGGPDASDEAPTEQQQRQQQLSGKRNLDSRPSWTMEIEACNKPGVPQGVCWVLAWVWRPNRRHVGYYVPSACPAHAHTQHTPQHRWHTAVVGVDGQWDHDDNLHHRGPQPCCGKRAHPCQAVHFSRAGHPHSRLPRSRLRLEGVEDEQFLDPVIDSVHPLDRCRICEDMSSSCQFASVHLFGTTARGFQLSQRQLILGRVGRAGTTSRSVSQSRAVSWCT